MNAENPILVKMNEWNIPPADLLWAMQHGGERPNDRRSKQLRGCARVGGAYLKPFDGEWTVHQARTDSGKRLVAFLDEAERVVLRLVSGREALPTEPDAYWRPEVNLSEVYALHQDGRWYQNISGNFVPEDEVPDGLILLGYYKVRTPDAAQ